MNCLIVLSILLANASGLVGLVTTTRYSRLFSINRHRRLDPLRPHRFRYHRTMSIGLLTNNENLNEQNNAKEAEETVLSKKFFFFGKKRTTKPPSDNNDDVSNNNKENNGRFAFLKEFLRINLPFFLGAIVTGLAFNKLQFFIFGCDVIQAVKSHAVTPLPPTAISVLLACSAIFGSFVMMPLTKYQEKKSGDKKENKRETERQEDKTERQEDKKDRKVEVLRQVLFQYQTRLYDLQSQKEQKSNRPFWHTLNSNSDDESNYLDKAIENTQAMEKHYQAEYNKHAGIVVPVSDSTKADNKEIITVKEVESKVKEAKLAIALADAKLKAAEQEKALLVAAEADKAAAE